MRKHRTLIICMAAAIAAGCATVPETISTPVAGPGINEVQASPDAHAGESVRWGGTIAGVQNRRAHTELTIVARELTRRGEPLGADPSTGRFIAVVDRFLDPEVYKPGRRVTAVGTIAGIRSDKVGNYPYEYPLVRATAVHLWEEYVRRDRYPYPYWPYYRGPYYRPYHWPFHPFHRYPYDPWYY